MDTSEADRVRKSISVQCSFPDVDSRHSVQTRRAGRSSVSPKPPSPVKTNGRYHVSGFLGEANTTYRTHASRNADKSPMSRKPQYRSLTKTPLWRFRRQSLLMSREKRDSVTASVVTTVRHRRTITARKAEGRLALPPYLEAKSILPYSLF